MRFSLNISFSDEALGMIRNAYLKVVLTKQVAGGGNPTTWVVFDPFSLNTMTWEQNYALYVSNTPVMVGATIMELCNTMAGDGMLYNFTNGRISGGTKGALPAGSYGIRNGMNEFDTLTMGLAQGVTVNGFTAPSRPLNASSVLCNQTAKFTPYEIVNVFLNPRFANNMVIDTVGSNATSLKYGGGVDTFDLSFDEASGKFVIR